MKEIIYNYDNLSEKDINDLSVRTKALIINDGYLLIGNANNLFQFPGGHIEENETIEESLKRELLEETGIEIEDNEIQKPFMKITYMNKDYPKDGINRKSEIYYYVIKTNKEPNLNKIKLTDHEKEGKFKIEKIPLNKAINIIEDNIPNNPKNEVISKDMILAINEYLKQTK